jgi:HUS1 checkpoint protein
MKFRALMTDTSVMKDFMNVATSLSKFSKECVMRITTRKVYFIISEEDNGPRRPLAWCELPVSFYFKEYNVVGVNEEYNEIYLEFSTALLARSVSPLKQSVKSLKIKLTNKDSPCLTLEMELASGNIESRQCVHDIPVEVISRKHWNDYEEPRFNDFHVSIEMPNLKTIKTIVERMRNMSHSLIVSATKDGRLTLQIKTNIVTLSAHFPDLSIESFASNNVKNLTVQMSNYLCF